MKLSQPTIEIKLKEAPEKENFVRYFTFVNKERKSRRLKVKFGRKKGLTFVAKSFPKGIDVLNSFLKPENRSHWDKMVLENRGGQLDLQIKRLKFVLNYSNGKKKNSVSVPILDGSLNRILDKGKARIQLNTLSARTRSKSAGLDASAAPLIRKAVQDLGKYGYPDGIMIPGLSDSKAKSDQSKAFALSYLIEFGVKLGEFAFTAEADYSDIPAVFRGKKRLSSYNKARKGFVNVSTRKVVQPVPGDYIEDRAEKGISGLITAWNPETKEATVIYGPYPVRTKVIDFANQPAGSPGYWLGSI
ncbi:MAG: hypothetical protein H6581_11945 [Bacteroidia bacterium]|nr:hypothetical protein [Bacteroidia bacterium]